MKNKKIIRINSIEIKNIKNVILGKVDLDKKVDDTCGSSIIGVYGQNGSGKTALIWAIDLLKIVLSGNKIPSSTSYYIFSSSDVASIKVNIDITISGRIYEAIYELVIKKIDDEHICISKEKLDYFAKANEVFNKTNKTTILSVETIGNEFLLDTCLYGPAIRIKELCNIDKSLKQKLIVLQALARSNNTSYIFNETLISMFNDSLANTIYFKIIETIMFYAKYNMFVLNKNSNLSYNMNILPLSIRFDENNIITKNDSLLLKLDTNIMNKESYNLVEKAINQIDILISKIVPGLNINIVNLDNKLDANGDEAMVFELVSNRNGIITPLRYESEGIKKILGILSSLIAMYNDQSVFVAIDELDSGVFEYLLGEILEVIKNTGKGQLVFTSHNMRPLEVLDSSSIYFTTTNPNNKYIQFTGIKNNNNLRNTFLRVIDLGGQKESIYENTDSYDIGKAFREAGDLYNEN